MADQFVLVRIVNMRGVDLSRFDFDYDLTWSAFFTDAQGNIYSRYGGRDHDHAEKHLTLPGLKYAMRSVLARHVAETKQGDKNSSTGKRTSEDLIRKANEPRFATPLSAQKEFFSPEQFPAAKSLQANSCIHCHQVYDLRRTGLEHEKKWTQDEIWVYPPPENVGLSVSPEQGDRVTKVSAGSPAEKVGIKAGDVLVSVSGLPVASFADVTYALHRAPKEGTLAVAWQRGEKGMTGKLPLTQGWKKSDIAWRSSMWGLSPTASVYGENLSQEEKKKLGLAENRLAFRQGRFVPKPAREAGIQADDIIIGIDGEELLMDMLHFNVHVRLTKKVGEKIEYNVIRNGKRLDFPSVLQAKDSF